jgi:hypothetical protein
MRPPLPELADPFTALEGRRVICKVDGMMLRGRLLSARGDFVTIEQDHGPRMSINRYEISTISEEQRPVSRCHKITKMFWK